MNDLGVVVMIRADDRRPDPAAILAALAGGARLVIVGTERMSAASLIAAAATVSFELAAPAPQHTHTIHVRPDVSVEVHYQTHGGRRGYGGRTGKGERKRNRAGRWA